MPSERIARRYLISGRVQGVGYRAATRREAQSLNLAGHAINLDDGRVEVLVEGEADAVRRLGDWLHRGPPFCTVSEVEEVDAEVGQRAGFGVG